MLRTNYIDPEWLGDRSYQMTTNADDNTVSFTDATTYINSGNYIGAADINATNVEVNRIANKYSSWS